jgi:uncharacterized protein (DUF433 family)
MIKRGTLIRMTDNAQSALEVPAYGVVQAAHYVGLPYATLRSWVGPTGLLTTPEPNVLSFSNLAEAHVLKSMRRIHRLSLQSIRKALSELSTIRKTAHPLLDENFGTDGVDLCLIEEDRVFNLNKKLQAEIREFVALYLERIERSNGYASKLYPFVARDDASEPRHVSISPVISFGRPVLAGTGIATAVIAGRFASRDSVHDLAREYGVAEGVLEDAIRWEMLKGKAA